MKYRPYDYNSCRSRGCDPMQLKSQISAHDFYMREQDLLRFGCRSGKWALAGLCPFHEDRTAGSFKVNLESGSYICFSCGVKGGDILSFTQVRYGLSFKEAMEKLRNEWGVSC